MQAHNVVTLPLLRGECTDNVPAFLLTPYNPMNWTPSASRSDVVRMIARYVRLKFSPRSATGRLVVHESRIDRKSLEIDIESASAAEVLDAIRNGFIRRAVYAQPEKRVDIKNSDGSTMRCVAPRRDVANIVKPKSKHGGSDDSQNAREWRATVAQKLGHLPKEWADSLVEAEEIRLELRGVRNQLAAARSEAQRLKHGGRGARNLRRHADERVAELRSSEQMMGDRLKSLVRSSGHRKGIEGLLIVCTRTAEVESYLFGDLAA